MPDEGIHFNPRSLHGERPAQHPDTPRRGHFNPRSPHGERPDRLHVQAVTGADFNPRSLHGERPSGENLLYYAEWISTHAPRTGSDLSAFVAL